MSRTYKAVVAIVIVAAIGYAGWRIREARRAAVSGLLSEKIARDGDTWTADFMARVAAPEQLVFDAIRNVEKSRSDQVRSVRVISEQGDNKTVDMELRWPGGQTVTMRLAFLYLPAEHRITYHTVDNPMINTEADYRFTDQGPNTLLIYHQSSRFGQQIPLPDSLVRQIIRDTFVAQLEGLRRALNLSDSEPSDEIGEEP